MGGLFQPFFAAGSQDKWVVDLQFWTREEPLLRKNEAKKESFEDDLTTFDYWETVVKVEKGRCVCYTNVRARDQNVETTSLLLLKLFKTYFLDMHTVQKMLFMGKKSSFHDL